jgi:hypothetical protein
MKNESLTKNRPAKSLSRTARNSMTFPRALRDAIPEAPGYSGRVLELNSIDAQVFDPLITTRVVHLNLHVQETGRLNGHFTLWMDLQPLAARALAATLNEVADRAESSPTR